MKKNIFFDENKIKHLGKKVIIGKTVRIRHPEFCTIGNNSIIDDFTYVSTKLQIGKNTHIASSVSIAGGQDYTCTIGDFCSVSAGVKIWCRSNDFVNDLIAIMPKGIKTNAVEGDVKIENYTGIGSNSVIMPDVTILEGASIGSLSFVKSHQILEPWTVYTGIPAKPTKKRNKKAVLEQLKEFAKFKKIQEKGLQ